MSDIKIVSVNNKSLLNKFIKFPFEVYKDDPNWVAPLNFERKQFFNPEKNPFYEHAEMDLFLAFKGEKLAGRIAAIKNSIHNDLHEDKLGFFGFYEVFNDQEVSDAMLDHCKVWLKERGLDSMRGPVSPSMNEDHSILLEGRDGPPRVGMAYTPEYYQPLLENYGLKKAKDLLAFKIEYDKIIKMEKLHRVAKLAKERYKMVVRPVNMKDFKGELNKFKMIYNKAWEKNWGFVPLTDAEIDKMADDYKQIIDPRLVLFAEIDGETVGAALTVPDFNLILQKMNGKLFPFNFLKLFTQKKNVNWLRIITLGLLKEQRNKGLDAVLYTEIMKRGADLGYRLAEASWILEDNQMMIRGAEAMGAHIYRKYRIYETEI